MSSRVQEIVRHVSFGNSKSSTKLFAQPDLARFKQPRMTVEQKQQAIEVAID
jgi:hypothetical protein